MWGVFLSRLLDEFDEHQPLTFMFIDDFMNSQPSLSESSEKIRMETVCPIWRFDGLTDLVGNVPPSRERRAPPESILMCYKKEA